MRPTIDCQSEKRIRSLSDLNNRSYQNGEKRQGHAMPLQIVLHDARLPR